MTRFLAESNSLVPNPKLDRANVAALKVVEVDAGAQLTWTRSQAARGWRVFRADASLGTPLRLIAVLPAEARSFLDGLDAPINPYRRGHAHTWIVLALA